MKRAGLVSLVECARYGDRDREKLAMIQAPFPRLSRREIDDGEEPGKKRSLDPAEEVSGGGSRRRRRRRHKKK